MFGFAAALSDLWASFGFYGDTYYEKESSQFLSVGIALCAIDYTPAASAATDPVRCHRTCRAAISSPD